jgi:hypothetical protein
MFFETNLVNEILLCEQCKGRLDLPKILPCGKTICSFCAPLNFLSTIDNKFDCLVCKNKHEVPKDGLIINEAILKLLSVKVMCVSRGKAFDALENFLDEIQKKHRCIKRGIENSTDLINEYCSDLRTEVQITAEEIILQVNDLSSKIFEEINEYEKELIEFNKTNSKSLDEFNKIAKELESFYTVNNEYLKQYVVDDEILLKSNKEASSLIRKAEMEIENLKDNIFNGQHFKCNNKPNTLIIIKSTNGNVFGGYTEKSWISMENEFFIADPNSFIFSLINKENRPLKMKWSQKEGICCYKRYGPTFGAYDFYIADKSNTNTNSYSNLGHSFTHPDYFYGSNEARSFLAGSFSFKVNEIEVFIKQ